MPERRERQNSILIVSGSEHFERVIRKAAAGKGFIAIDVRNSASAARRCALERYYDIVVIDAPLKDEPGHELALDIAYKYNTSIMMASPPEIFGDINDLVIDSGVLVILKPLSDHGTENSIRFLSAEQNRFRELENRLIKAEEKAEEIRAVSRAKIILMEKKHISEEDAHRLIGKLAMNNGVSRKRIAEKIIEDA
ncbi:MAG: ANTAR domain-containing protein [Lachnospiraceae bacterium]|nr:ANTAR domain-containing protein [Lachnospiraceae bacterium]